MTPASPGSTVPFFPASPSAASEGLRLLVVEDDAVDRRALQRHVAEHRLPYALVEAVTLAEARAQLAAGSFDAVLLDHRLPDGEGIDLLAEHTDVPKVLVSGMDNLALAVRALKSGAADYLLKDLDRRYLQILPHTLERAVAERRAREWVRWSNALLRETIEALPAAVFTADRDGCVTSFNRETVALWGREPRIGRDAERLGEAFRCSLPDGTPLSFAALMEGAMPSDPPPQVELVVDFGDNRRRRVLASRRALRAPDGGTAGWVHIWMDLTETRRIEHRERVLEAHFNHARKLEAVGTLAGGVAHEFNNQLAAIMGNIQLAQLEIPPGHVVEPWLRDSLQSCRRARDVVQRMLELGHDPQFALVRESLQPMVDDLAEIARPRMPEGVRLEIEVDRDCPEVSCYVPEIRQALLQLLDNAIEAMTGRTGMIRLSLRHRTPSETFRERYPHITAGHTVCLAVSDQGEGMSAERIERVFEPFYTTRDPGKGPGLGLAGVYGIAKRHGAATVVESALFEGTTVSIFFLPAGGGERSLAAFRETLRRQQAPGGVV